MQFTLMDFQTDAVTDILNALKRCRRDWREDSERSAFALSAPTGSGKTVIAATVIEALLHGSDEFDFEPDPTAVVLWVTKDPSLNEQTRNRIIAAADRVPISTLHVVDNNFTGDKLDAGNVYFINTGKLAVTSLLVRKSDSRTTTFWEVLHNTITDPAKTLYLILDEAHEGMKPSVGNAEAERLTLVRKIIDGANGYAAAPIVFGLSATPDRFEAAMAKTGQRTQRPLIKVDPVRVQKSGLLKASLQMVFPDEAGDFTTTLVREAITELDHMTTRWASYCQREGVTPAVRPLAVVQIPNREDDKTEPEDRLIRRILDTVRLALPGFDTRQVAHVLGDRDTISLGEWTVPKVAPELVQDDPELRILIAKDAVSTGWDCPRAEVLVSLRPARDRTYITQLLGRMVRTPLARTTSDEHLNSASVYLPLFDRAAAKQVADDIMGTGSGGAVTGPTVMMKPTDLTWNAAVPQDLKGVIASLPSLPKPAVAPKPIKRMLAMAAALAGDGLAEKPDETAVGKLCAVIDGFLAEHATQVDKVAAGIRTAELNRHTVNLSDGSIAETAAHTGADTDTVDDALRLVSRVLSSKVVNAWLRGKFLSAADTDPNFDQDAIKARLAAAPLIDVGQGDTVVARVEKAADAQVAEWFDAIRAVLPSLGDEKRDRYDKIRAQAGTPQETPIRLPSALVVDTVDADQNPLETAELHVLADAAGRVPLGKLTSWEAQVLATELARPNVVGWYRNPASGAAALQIAYHTPAGWKSLQPDFIVFEENSDATIRPSIVDPHGHYLADAVAKLHALARYADRFADRFNRVDAVAAVEAGGPLRVLELHRAEVRTAVLAGDDAKQLFSGPVSQLY